MGRCAGMYHLTQRTRLQLLHRLEHRVLNLPQRGLRMRPPPLRYLLRHRLARGLPPRQNLLHLVVLTHPQLRPPYRNAGVALYRITQNLAGHPFAAASFDIVYAHLSLHYFDHATTAALTKECRRVLRPGGVLCVRCKSVDDPLYGGGEPLGGDRFVLDGQVRHFFSRDYLRDLLGGWQVLSLRRTRGFYGPRTMRSAFIEGIARPACSRKQLRT